MGGALLCSWAVVPASVARIAWLSTDGLESRALRTGVTLVAGFLTYLALLILLGGALALSLAGCNA